MSRRKQFSEDSTVHLDLSSGGSLSLSFKGNLWELTEDERNLIAKVSDLVQRYKDAEAPPLEQGAGA
jgi:hypothetical protein